MAEQFDVICIGAGTAGEALADGLKGSGLSLAVITCAVTATVTATAEGSDRLAALDLPHAA